MNISVGDWTNYRKAREELRKKVIARATNYPDESYASIGRRFEISGPLVSYYVRKAGILRTKGRKSRASLGGN
jgi:hypothetical protein